MASRTNPGRSKVSIVGKVPSRACEAPVGRARVKHLKYFTCNSNTQRASYGLDMRDMPEYPKPTMSSCFLVKKM